MFYAGQVLYTSYTQTYSQEAMKCKCGTNGNTGHECQTSYKKEDIKPHYLISVTQKDLEENLNAHYPTR